MRRGGGINRQNHAQNDPASLTARLGERFAYSTHQRGLQGALSQEEHKQRQKQFLARFAKIERDILSRTVFVSHVQDLRDRKNKQGLRRFFEKRYGPVQDCSPLKFERRGKQFQLGSLPMTDARVMFRDKVHAEKIFGGVDLLRARHHPRSVTLNCHLGDMEKGKKRTPRITVRPCEPYPDLVKNELERSVIEFSATGLHLGHWFPGEEDMYRTWCKEEGRDEDQQVDPDIWLEVYDTEIKPLIRIDLRRRLVEIGVERNHDMVQNVFDFRDGTDFISFRFKDLFNYIDICHDEGDESVHSLIFSLKYPPTLESDTPLYGLGFACPETERERCITFGGLDATVFGTCLSYRLPLSEASANTLLLHGGLHRLRDFGVMRRELYGLEQSRPIKQTLTKEADDRARVSEALKHIHRQQPEIGILLRALLDNDKICPYHAWNNTTELIEGFHVNMFDLVQNLMCTRQDDLLAQTLETIHEAHGKTKYPCQLLNKLAPAEAKEVPHKNVPDYCFAVPRVLLSPCKQLIVGIEVEVSNRVVRKFVRDEGFRPTSFLRLHIGDEDAQKIFYASLTKCVEQRIKSCIREGIVINGQKYLFLAYSSSQLKECSMWMVCPEHGWTVEEMRKSLGNFDSCRTASKYSARIGQCFSTTIQGPKGPGVWALSGELRLRHQEIDDIWTRDRSTRDRVRSKCHSDGTGMIQREALTRLLKSHPHGPTKPSDASIIQIRYGGYKGTLVAWDNFNTVRSLSSPESTHPDLYLRPSMNKFKARCEYLEVCNIGSHVSYYLNRNVILLLGVHGVKDHIFMQMQKVMLDNLDEMLRSRVKALELVPRLSGPDSAQRKLLMHMLISGLSPASDPFLFCCLHAIRSHSIFGLRKKARIFVDRGVVLIGGVDETGLLPEGCVFVQVRKKAPQDPWSTEEDYQPIEGPVMVTKHPVMHPGDVRMLLAVDIPELRSHKNVILFSKLGPRPEPDKMAGSDLDGDEFAITYDERLFLNEWNQCMKDRNGRFVMHPNQGRLARGAASSLSTSAEEMRFSSAILQRANGAPLDYDDPPPGKIAYLPTEEKQKSDALVDHFFDYVRRDNLGRIGMMWQDYAALFRADCRECIELAKLHSIAVDFAKTGVPADPQKWSMPRTMPRAHWREKKDAPSFHCRSVIGKLYDDVTRRADCGFDTSPLALAGRKHDSYGQVLIEAEDNWIENHLKRIYNHQIPLALGISDNDNKELQEFANRERIVYTHRVTSLMTKYGLRSEGELFTGCIRKYHRLQKKRQHEFSEEVRRACDLIYREHRKAFFREVSSIASSLVDGRTSLQGLTPAIGQLQFEDADEVVPAQTVVREPHKEERTEAEILKDVEDAATARFLATDASDHTKEMRRVAHQLAAAYYMATYSPELRWQEKEDGNTSALFSFPWIVADVISCGVCQNST